MTLLSFSNVQYCPKCRDPRSLDPTYHHRIFSNIEYLEYICKCGFCFRTETADTKHLDLSGIGSKVYKRIELDHNHPNFTHSSIDIVEELTNQNDGR